MTEGPPSHRRSRPGHLAAETALTLGAVLGVLCALWAVASVALGLTPLVLVSGSMSPAIGTGDLAVARSVPASAVSVGDVVSVRDSGGVRVTHRVVRTGPDGSEGEARALVLRGDANASPDPSPYVVTSVDRVVLHVPHAGRVVAAVSSRVGLLVVCVLVAGLMLLGFGSAPPRSGAGGAVGAVACGAVVLGVGGAVPPPVPTSAYLSDAAAVAGGPLRAGAMVAPTIGCSGGGLFDRPTISWSVPQSPAPLQYEVTYGSTTHTVTGTTWLVPAGLLAIGTYAVTVRSQRATWSSGPSNTVSVRMTTLAAGVCA